MGITLHGLTASSKDPYIADLFNYISSKPGKMYQFVKYLKSEQKSIVILDNSTAIYDLSLVANYFSKFFKSTFTIEVILLFLHLIKCMSPSQQIN